MKKIKQKVPMDKSQRTVFIVYFFLFVVTSLLFLYPLFWMFINSLKTNTEIASNSLAFPGTWNFNRYAEVFTKFNEVRGVRYIYYFEMLWNSIWQTCGGQFLNIMASAMVAYPLARYKFPLHKFFFGLIVFRITIPVIGAGPAAYKFMDALGLRNNPLYIITDFNGFDINALIFYGYFKAIDRGYSEAAYIDGASPFTVFFKIMLPQSIPCFIALYIRCVMGYWSVYSTAQIYLPNFPNLALGIYNFGILTKGSGAEQIPNAQAIYYAAIIISCLPPIILFAFSQKTMMKNLSVGGLKG